MLRRIEGYGRLMRTAWRRSAPLGGAQHRSAALSTARRRLARASDFMGRCYHFPIEKKYTVLPEI